MLIKKKKRIPSKYYDPNILKNISDIMDLDGIGLFLEYNQIKKEDDMSLNKADKEWIVNTVSKVVSKAVLESEKRIMAKSDERWAKNDERWEKNDERWEKQFKFNEEQLKFNREQLKFNREHKH